MIEAESGYLYEIVSSQGIVWLKRKMPMKTLHILFADANQKRGK